MEEAVKEPVAPATTEPTVEAPVVKEEAQAPVEPIADVEKSVPYDRFREVNEERKLYMQELQALRNQLQVQPQEKVYTVNELKEYRRQYVNDAKKAAEAGDYATQADLLDRAYQVADMIADKVADEKAALRSQEMERVIADKLDRQALEKEYADLTDSNSELYKMTNKLMNERRNLTPRDAAELAAARIGKTPQKQVFTPKGANTVSNGQTFPKGTVQLSDQQRRVALGMGLTEEAYAKSLTAINQGVRYGS
jgi:hypothetical protein